MNYLGKTLIIFGLVVTLVGVGIILLPKAPYLSNLGRLPGDIRMERGNFSLYFPVATCLVLSLALTLIFWLIGYFKH